MRIETHVEIKEVRTDRYGSAAQAELLERGWSIIGSKAVEPGADGTITFRNAGLKVGQIVKVTFEVE